MLRNLLFSIFFFTGIILISILFLPSLLMSQKIVLFGGKLMGYWASIKLKIFLSTKIIVKGKVFILKKELLLIPIFGWYLKKIGSIPIKRDKISKENLNFFEEISKTVNNSNRPLIIFPQATRVLPTERPPFKKGVARIYRELNIFCQPIAINSGFVWPKKGKKIPNKEIIISILKPINPGLEKEEFIISLEEKIYSELDRIN